MALPHFEVASGTIDGVNVIFNVSMPYKPGTTAVFLNGLLLREDYPDGWLESDPVTGEVTLKEPPRVTKITPDVVQVFFIDTSPDVLDAVIVERLVGYLRGVDVLDGRLLEVVELRGAVDVVDGLDGCLLDEFSIHGELEAEGVLHGRLEAVC